MGGGGDSGLSRASTGARRTGLPLLSAETARRAAAAEKERGGRPRSLGSGLAGGSRIRSGGGGGGSGLSGVGGRGGAVDSLLAPFNCVTVGRNMSRDLRKLREDTGGLRSPPNEQRRRVISVDSEIKARLFDLNEIKAT